jgi:GNAT superfamily N-acetyltransferase
MTIYEWRMAHSFFIHDARDRQLDELGELMVSVYSSLDGFPSEGAQPGYYEVLRSVRRLAEKPGTKVLAASIENVIVGGVVYFSDMTQYGSGGTAIREKNASAFRLLAVSPQARGMGIGVALVAQCIHLAKQAGHGQVVIHTTDAMKVARRMYERLGFARSPDLDFMQEGLHVFGLRLVL